MKARPEPPSTTFDVAETTAVLVRTPAVLRSMLTGLSDDWTRRDEGPGTWSAFDVVGHLIDGEETDWMIRARIILAKGADRRFEPFDRFRHQEANRGASLDELIDRFAALRAWNLRELEALELTAADLRRTGEHPAFGTVTLAQLLATWAVHDLNHLAQIARVMAKRYSEAVGPWAEYLPVLGR